ncbi:hypothetical protein XELAEV_18021101mg [Xenopus laevis]|uniref:Uncharacterized protein n=1 Tax=Xenopus laevis TaxID=8355 RepID=A0A974HRN3_XENLA|nr:hypothetical protein XELAEV_18021101mg [Xenopus laevis]
MKSYWEEVLNIINKLTCSNITIDHQAQILLHLPFGEKKRWDTLTLFLLQSVKALVPKKWKTELALTLTEWIINTEEMRRMEEIAHLIHNQSNTFWKIWSPWITYIKSL